MARNRYLRNPLGWHVTQTLVVDPSRFIAKKPPTEKDKGKKSDGRRSPHQEERKATHANQKYTAEPARGCEHRQSVSSLVCLMKAKNLTILVVCRGEPDRERFQQNGPGW